MNGLTIIIFSCICFIVAYRTYGSYLVRQWDVDPTRKTPAHTNYDGVDYVPAKSPVLLGHHFASIAGAGPIVGPISASIFGWFPVVLWIIVGSIFVGGVHDFGSLFASARHKGKSIGEVIEANMGTSGKKLFAVFAWLTLVLVIAAFLNVVADTFVATPSAATSSILFIALAIIFGFSIYRQGLPLGITTIIAVVLLFICVWIGLNFPLVLPKSTWMIILIGYIFVASVTPVWVLLQPRDYLNSFLLYIMMGGAFLGLLIYRPGLELPAVTSWSIDGQLLFPMLFVTVACGAISGFHSLVGSGTTSKQLNSEGDAKLVGYGGMLIEGVLAIIAILTAAYVTQGRLGELLGEGGPIHVFSHGVGTFTTFIGVDFEIGSTFAALALSAFALTSLDTGTRLSRFIFQEFFGAETNDDGSAGNPLSNRYIATAISIAAGGGLAFYGYAVIWPMFGSANQLLAALAFLALAVWMAKLGKNNKMFLYPMYFMAIVTLSALVIMIKANFGVNNILVVIAAALFILAIVLLAQAQKVLSNIKPSDGTHIDG